MRAWGRPTLLLLAAAAIAACPHDFTRPARDGGPRDRDVGAGDSRPRDLAREAPCRTNAECDDSLLCTEDICTSMGCAHNPRSGQCHIGGRCYDRDEVSPDTPCERCDPASPLAFTAFLGKGCVGTLAGGLSSGYVDGPANQARFNALAGVAVDAAGAVYVADFGAIRKVYQGMVSTVAGSASTGFQDGPAGAALFYHPRGVALSPDGLAVADMDNHAIRWLSLGALTVSTLAGGTAGFSDGPAATAKLTEPEGVAYGPGGLYFTADNRIRFLADAAPRTVSTLAGSGSQGYSDGPAASAQFWDVRELAVLGDNIFVADRRNHRIRRIRRDGATAEVTTLAGTVAGFQDGPGHQARFYSPTGLALGEVTSSSFALYIADVSNHRIRRVSVLWPSVTVTVSTLAGDGTSGRRDGLASTARFYEPVGLAVDGTGKIYVADWANNAIRVINP